MQDPSTSENIAAAPTKLSVRQVLFGHAVLLIFCVGLPALFTAAAPLTVTRFFRQDGLVHARISKRMFFVVPFRQTTIQGVHSVGDRFVPGFRTRSQTPGQSRSVQGEDSSHLSIEGPMGATSVEVSPVNIESVLKRAGDFLNDPAQQELQLVTVANWKFGVFAGGFLCLLTVLYGYLLASQLFRWAFGKPN